MCMTGDKATSGFSNSHTTYTDLHEHDGHMHDANSFLPERLGQLGGILNHICVFQAWLERVVKLSPLGKEFVLVFYQD